MRNQLEKQTSTIVRTSACCVLKAALEYQIKTLSHIILLLLLPASAETGENSWRRPLASRNNYPIAILFIALEPETSSVLERWGKSLRLNLDYSNILAHDVAGSESLLLDMELPRTVVQFQMGLGNGIEIGASLPIHTMYGGFLDPLISGIHDSFGFPNKFRSSRPNNLFQYRYYIDGVPVLERFDGTTGLGDLSLRAKKRLGQISRAGIEVALQGAIKIPTGNRKDLSGSGTTDYGIGFIASNTGEKFGAYFNFNYHVLGEAEGMATRNFLSLMSAFDWRFSSSWPNLVMVLQYDQFQRFLKSELQVLNQSARQFILGLRWRKSERWQFEWRLAEDISTAMTPDFTFGFQVAVNWPGTNHP